MEMKFCFNEKYKKSQFCVTSSKLPWVPEGFRGPLRDLPAEGAGHNRDIDRDRKPPKTNLWHPGYVEVVHCNKSDCYWLSGSTVCDVNFKMR